MARVLLLTPQVPYPPEQGTSLRNWHIVQALAEEHDVTLLSFSERESENGLETLRGLVQVLTLIPAPRRSAWRRMAGLLLSDEPDMALRLRSDQFTVALRESLRSQLFDVVQIEGLELAHTIITIRETLPEVRILLDCHNAEAELQRRAMAADAGHFRRLPAALYSRLQVSRLERFERWACRSADRVVAVSDGDRHALARYLPADESVTVIPNAVDVAEYARPVTVAPNQRSDVLFTGKMDYRPNVDGVLWFADEVWPLIRQSNPGATWFIVGQKPHARLDRLRQLPGVTLTGYVPTVMPYLAGAKVYVVPLRVGSGTRLKIIEAMAAALPIVSTTVGAEGFEVLSGRELMLADSATEFAATVVNLLNDEEERARLGEAGRRFADRYDRQQMKSAFRALYASLD